MICHEITRNEGIRTRRNSVETAILYGRTLFSVSQVLVGQEPTMPYWYWYLFVVIQWYTRTIRVYKDGIVSSLGHCEHQFYDHLGKNSGVSWIPGDSWISFKNLQNKCVYIYIIKRENKKHFPVTLIILDTSRSQLHLCDGCIIWPWWATAMTSITADFFVCKVQLWRTGQMKLLDIGRPCWFQMIWQWHGLHFDKCTMLSMIWFLLHWHLPGLDIPTLLKMKFEGGTRTEISF